MGTNSRPGSARVTRPAAPVTSVPVSHVAQGDCISSRPAPPAESACKAGGRPVFMGGRMVPTTWCRSWGQRALEEELKPLPLTPVPVHMATPLEAQLAEALGVADSKNWPRLPLEVGSCEQGNRCCWRWLARAALEQVAGVPLSHLSLPEAIARLREEILELAERRKWCETAEMELEQAASDRQQWQELQMTHRECEHELEELRAARAGAAEMRAELVEQRAKFQQLHADHVDLQSECNKITTKHDMLVHGDLLTAQKRAETAEEELRTNVQSRIELKVVNDDLNRQLLGLRQEIVALKQDKIVLMKAQEEALAQKKKKRKKYKPVIPKFR